MAGLCHSLCISEIKGIKGMTYVNFGWCKTCKKYYEKPTDLRCYCCGNLIRQNTRYSKSKYKQQGVRIE